MAQQAGMMNTGVGHPSPQRGRLGLFVLLLGIVAVPVLWFLQMLLSYGLASVACYPSWSPLTAPRWSWLATALGTVGIVALLAGIASGLLAWRSWRLTRDEQQGRQQHLLDVGEGRTRFLAMCGLLTSGGFVVLLLFTTVTLLIVPPCGV